VTTDLEKLRLFALFILEEFPEGMPDEFDMQDKAEKLGLLEKVEAQEPCGENCWCNEYHGEFPVTCYRRSKVLLGK